MQPDKTMEDTEEAPGGRLGSDGSRRDEVGKNRLLSALAPDAFSELEGVLERVHLETGEILAEPGEHISHIVFPEASIVSVVNYMADGSGVEVGTVGNEGMAGLPAYLEADANEAQTFCQLAGPALRAPVGAVITAARRWAR